MTDKQEKGRANRLKWWWITCISIFFILQFIFFAIDGTYLEPNLNDTMWADWLTGSKLFTEWITPFSYPWFNMVTVLFATVLLLKAVTDIFTIKKNKKQRT